MKEGTNVHIEVRERGKLASVRDIHNVWTVAGRTYLAQMLSLSSIDPDVEERDGHIKYIGFGMGGVAQNQQSMVTSPVLSTVYPVSSTPHGTAFTFDHDYYENITSLEMPIPILPSQLADSYASPVGIAWRDNVTANNDVFPYAVHPAPGVFRFVFTARQLGLVLGTFVHEPPYTGNKYPFMPLSEVGLYTDEADPDDPFEPPLCYTNFDTIQISVDTHIFLTWDVVF